MLYADPFHNYSVPLVVPAHQALEKWAAGAGIKYNNFAEVCDEKESVNEVQQFLSKVAKVANLKLLQRLSCFQNHGRLNLDWLLQLSRLRGKSSRPSSKMNYKNYTSDVMLRLSSIAN